MTGIENNPLYQGMPQISRAGGPTAFLGYDESAKKQVPKDKSKKIRGKESKLEEEGEEAK